MSIRHLPRTLPIRRWLAIALAALFLMPALTIAVIGIILFRETQGPQSADDLAASRLREDVALWEDPGWQDATRSELAEEGVDFVLLVDGQEVYRTADDPLAGTDDGDERAARQLVVTGSDPRRTATIYADPIEGPPEELRVWFVPLILLTVLLATLSGIAWFFGRTVVMPLTATSDAARQIAVGDLDITLPGSRVREVAALNRAFASMSEELRSSLQRQAGMEEERRLFISAIVHDLRTPLFSLRGSLEGLAKGITDTPEKRDRYIAVAQDKAEQLERLISDLFAFTRLEYLDQAPNRTSLDLAELLTRLVDGLRHQAEAKGVELALAGSPAPCVVYGDSHLLTRAIENLLDNALRHTPDGGAVQVTWRETGHHMEFSVADTGPGIPVQDLPHLFEPLFRGEASRNRKTGGAGLGLTIARRIMVAHGGDLIARNSPEGGAEFIGALPRRVGTPSEGPSS